EAEVQSTLIKTRIANHQNSSLTSVLAAVDQLTKDTMSAMHKVALIQLEVSCHGYSRMQTWRGVKGASRANHLGHRYSQSRREREVLSSLHLGAIGATGATSAPSAL
ncbi:hypothetical protein N657DRAFT_568390, partial [Parathielavia appendiculata]